MKGSRVQFLRICCIYLSVIGHAVAEVFTSMADVENLVNTERKIVDMLRLLIKAEQEKIISIENYIEEFTETYEKDNVDPMRIVSHPVNAFLLVKHLSVDWGNLKAYLGNDFTGAALDYIEKLRSSTRFPEEEDIKGAAEGFVRLQKTYKISTEDFAAGNIPGIAPARPMTAFECHLIGHRLALEKNHLYAASWLEIALKKLKEDNAEPKDHAKEIESLDWLQYSYHQMGNPYVALNLSQRVKELDPNFPTVDSNMEFYTKMMNDMPENVVDIIKCQPRPPVLLDHGGAYEALCRGEGILSSNVTRQLRCYYETYNNPALIIQPLKYEIAHVSPDIFIVHDVALESQMDKVKQIAMKHLQRATVVKPGSIGTEFTKIRISKSAFLDEPIDPVIVAVNKRIAQVTNFDMKHAEHLQVANYGIGGHYNAHYDFFRNPNDPDTKQIEEHLGDRIATLLMYMTDVEAGGATTFPSINVTLFPQKGSAAFWYNLYKDGKGDVRTLHEGCPVLAGNKWVSNKWIREIGQHVFRPCALFKDSPNDTSVASEVIF